MGGGMEEGQEGGEEGGGSEGAMLPGQTATPEWGKGRGQGRRRVVATPAEPNHSTAQPGHAARPVSTVSQPGQSARPAWRRAVAVTR